MFSNFYFFYRSFCQCKRITSWNIVQLQFFTRKKWCINILKLRHSFYKSTIQITKISSHIYDFTVAVYLRYIPDSKALTDTRIDRDEVIWKSETMGALINQREEYDTELSEFLILADNCTIESLVSNSGIIETQRFSCSFNRKEEET